MQSIRLLAIVLTLSACASPVPTLSPLPTRLQPTASLPPTAPLTVTPEATVTETFGGITFARPATWTAWQPNQFIPINPGPGLYVANFPLLPECATRPPASPNPPDANGEACQWPFDKLPDGGVFIEIYSDRLLRPMPTAGEPIELLGRPSWLLTTTPGPYDPAGDATLSAAIVTCGPEACSPDAYGAAGATSEHIVASLRGPGLEANEAAVREFFASLR